MFYRFSYTSYKHSMLATVCSFLGNMFLVMAIVMFVLGITGQESFSEMIPPVLAFLVIGLALTAGLAPRIAASKAKKLAKQAAAQGGSQPRQSATADAYSQSAAGAQSRSAPQEGVAPTMSLEELVAQVQR